MWYDPGRVLLIIGALTVVGCGGGISVQVELSGSTDCTYLQLSASLAGRPGDPGYYSLYCAGTTPPPIELPADASGALKIEVYGLDPNDCVLSHGSGGTQLSGPGPYRVEVPLGPAVGCLVDSGTQGDVSGLWGAQADDIWAPGCVGSTGFLIHWNGTAWTTAFNLADGCMSSIWGTSSRDIWMVGDQGVILHWDGSAWSSIKSGTTAVLFDIWGSAPDDVWSVGEHGVILHWDGSAWSSVPSGTTSTPRQIWGSGPRDVWIVEEDGKLLHWDGAAWTIEAFPATAEFVPLAVWGSGPDDIWLVGDGCDKPDPTRGSLSACSAWHWNGTSWASSLVPNSVGLWAVWGSGPNDYWADDDYQTLIHWDGSAWSLVPYLGQNQFRPLWGPGPKEVWAIGIQGVFTHFRL